MSAEPERLEDNPALAVFESLAEEFGKPAAWKVLHIMRGQRAPTVKSVEVRLARQKFRDLLKSHPNASHRTLARLAGISHMTALRWRKEMEHPARLVTPSCDLLDVKAEAPTVAVREQPPQSPADDYSLIARAWRGGVR